MKDNNRNRLDRCRCGCAEEMHYDEKGKPSACHEQCPMHCQYYARIGGEDMTAINRLLDQIREQAKHPYRKG